MPETVEALNRHFDRIRIDAGSPQISQHSLDWLMSQRRLVPEASFNKILAPADCPVLSSRCTLEWYRQTENVSAISPSADRLLSGTCEIIVANEHLPGEHPLTENDIHREIGSEGIARLVQAFYRHVPGDNVLGPMYPDDDLPGAEERLRLFLMFRFGGPQDYLQHRGHPKLRARHAPFTIDQMARDRWMSLMGRAIDECRFSADVEKVLRGFLGHVATFLINRT